MVRDEHSETQHACVTQAPVKIAKLISLDISQNDSIRIIDLEPSPFVGHDIRIYLFDDVSVAPPLQEIFVRILNAVSGTQFCANLVLILPDAAAVKTVKVKISKN